MRFILFSLVLVYAALHMPALAQEARFFSIMGDVPLMSGMSERADEAAVFDQAEGRVAQALASIGALQERDVLAFYAQTLPQLGWTRIGGRAYEREDERLELAFETSGISGNQLRFLRVLIRPAVSF